MPVVIRHNYADFSTYFGLAFLKILPQNGLLLPVLPCKMTKNYVSHYFTHVQKKLPSCDIECKHSNEDRSFDGVFCSPEVNVALQHGYKILQIPYTKYGIGKMTE